KHSQSRDVDFLQHRALIHIRVVFRKVETKLKAYVYGWPDGLFLVLAGKLNKKPALKRLGMNFAIFININEL
ncbi:MAG TPA: hypothetical protein VMY06_03885, partial [Sedimentisphaerales bacterium]|nr:hypothetical protein [Sedimentisphaerales bacterium]